MMTGSEILRIGEFFRRKSGEMAPVLAMGACFSPNRQLRYEVCSVPQLPQDLPWDDEDRCPDGFSPIDPDTLEFTYTERFWERRKHSFVWDFTWPASLRSAGAIDFCSPDRGPRLYNFSGEDTADQMPGPEQVTAVVWEIYAGDGKEARLYEVASVYDGFPFRIPRVSLDEWAWAHWANPRVVTSHPFEIEELVQKVTAAGGEVHHKEAHAGYEISTNHIHKYLERSEDLLYHPNQPLMPWLDFVLDGGSRPESSSLLDDALDAPSPSPETDPETDIDPLFEGL